MQFFQNVFHPIFIFALFLVGTHQQDCHFDESNRYPLIPVDEIQPLAVFKNFTSGKILEVLELPPNHPYIHMEYTIEDGNGRLDVELTASLTDYFRDPSNNPQFFISFRTNCSDGTSSIIDATIEVIDFNDPPEFDAPTSTFIVQTPWVLDIPVNHNQDVFVLDWDNNPDFTDLSFTSSDPKVRVEATEIQGGGRPKRYSLKLFLTEQLTETLNFNVLASDANDASIDPVPHPFEIQVEPLNIYPPTFAKHFYKAEIPPGPGLPVEGDEIPGIEGGPIIITDQEGNAFSVTTNSDLIRVEVDSVDPTTYKIFFDRDVTEADLRIDRGIAVVDITATEDGLPSLSSTIVFLLYLPELSDVTAPSTIATESTCPPCEVTTDATLSSTICPEVTTVTECPEPTPTTCEPSSSATEVTCEPCSSTTEVTSSVTDCPEISTIYVSTPCSENTDTPVTSETTSASPVTECPDVCTTTAASEQSPSACPDLTTVYVSTPCPEIPDCTSTPNTPITSGTSDCPVTDCPDVCSTPSAPPELSTTCPPVSEVPCVPCVSTVSPPDDVSCPTCGPCEPDPECSTPPPEQNSCPPVGGDDNDDDCSNTGFIVGLVVLSVLLVVCLGIAGYLWFKLRKNDPLKGLTPAESWVPDIVEPMNLDNDKEFLVSPREIDSLPRASTSYSVVSDSPSKPKKPEPVNFGTLGRGNPPVLEEELSQATNPLVDDSPIPVSAPAPSPAAIPKPEPPIPKPDYPAGVVFDERVEVFTPAPQEYPSSEDEADSNKNETEPADESSTKSDNVNEVVNDENEGDEKL